MQRQSQRETRLTGWNDFGKTASLDLTPQGFSIDAATGGIFFFETPKRNTVFTGLGGKDFHSELEQAQSSAENQIIEDVFPDEAYGLMTKNRDEEKFVVLDVTRPKEFDKLHLENAVNLDFFSKDFKTSLKALDKDKTYLVYCKIGGRSKMAQKQMKKLGFQKVYNVKGGTILWQEEGLPFAAGFDRRTRFTFGPLSISLILFVRARKMLNKGYEVLSPGRRQPAH